MSDNFAENEKSEVSCDPTVTRSEFISKLVRRSAIAGTIMLAPLIVDTFLAPPATAAGSTSAAGSTAADAVNTGETYAGLFF